MQELEKGLDQLLAFYSEQPEEEAEAEMEQAAASSAAGENDSGIKAQQAAAKAPKRSKRSRISSRGD